MLPVSPFLRYGLSSFQAGISPSFKLGLSLEKRTLSLECISLSLLLTLHSTPSKFFLKKCFYFLKEEKRKKKPFTAPLTRQMQMMPAGFDGSSMLELQLPCACTHLDMYQVTLAATTPPTLQLKLSPIGTWSQLLSVNTEHTPNTVPSLCRKCIFTEASLDRRGMFQKRQ